MNIFDLWAFCGSDSKEFPCNAGDQGSIPGSGRSHFSTLAQRIPWTEEPGGLSPWACKELDTTEHLSTTTQISGKIVVINKCYWLFVRKINAEELFEKPLIFLCYIK